MNIENQSINTEGGILTENNTRFRHLFREHSEALGKLNMVFGDEKFAEIKKLFFAVLQENEEFAGLFFNAPAGYLVLDDRYNIKRINNPGRILLRSETAEPCGEKLSDYIAQESLDAFHYFIKNLKAGKPTDICKLKLKDQSGTVLFTGTSGMEREIDNQSYRLIFFESSANTYSIPSEISVKDEITNSDGSSLPENAGNQGELALEKILERLNILVADDDEIARFYLSELFEKKCRKMLFAKNGKEAVELFQGNSDINLILMDIKMPVMDGYSATIKIKELNKQVVVVAQTAYALASDREKALAAGCDDYLAKPLLKKDLFLVIEKFFK